MLLTREQFDQKFSEGNLKIAFIGMSNIGKSHWSQALRDYKKFSVVSVDNEIEKNLGLADMAEMAAWMGYPFEEKYVTHAQEYLDLEADKTRVEIPEGNFILDTTGSVIYLRPDIWNFLRENFLIVCFDASEEMRQEMAALYFEEPKSIVWGNDFNMQEGELGIDALRRCYPGLLNNRKKLYRELGEVFVPGEFSRIKNLEVKRFWEVLRLSLPK